MRSSIGRSTAIATRTATEIQMNTDAARTTENQINVVIATIAADQTSP